MAGYELRVKASVARDLRAMPKKDVVRILKRIESLATDPRPRGCEKLTDQERHRLRQGRYPIVYEIREDELLVTVVKIAHRSSAYR